jgi:hypothetical protein
VDEVEAKYRATKCSYCGALLRIDGGCRMWYGSPHDLPYNERNTMAEFPKDVEVQGSWIAAVLRPGDRLVIGFNHPLDMLQAGKVKENLQERLPGVDFVIIDGVSSMNVYRPEPEPYEKIYGPGDVPPA